MQHIKTIIALLMTLYADAIVFDIDNDHSENPDEWLTPDKVSSLFSNIPILIQYSRNNMKAKNGKTPRPNHAD